jgi:excisionase family DNA binding protein
MEVRFNDKELNHLARLVAQRLDIRKSNDAEPWIRVTQAAEYLNCKPNRIYFLVSRNRIPYRRDGKRIVFRRSELDEYLLINSFSELRAEEAPQEEDRRATQNGSS